LLIEPLENRNLMAGLELEVLGSYFAPSGASAEIAAYDASSQRVFYTSATTNELGIVSIANPAAPSEVALIDLSSYGGGPNSVAVKNGIVAVAVQADIKTDDGSVLFFDANGLFLGQVTVGALPDMLTFTADGQKILVANEGEPNSYGQADSVDPEGSISVIDLSGGLASATVATADFSAFIGQEVALRAEGIRIFGPGANAAQDFEPEYITVSPDGLTAYVTLQENNALATINMA
jgi:DNA-binding beta-propeller fold protein YncE